MEVLPHEHHDTVSGTINFTRQISGYHSGTNLLFLAFQKESR